MRASSIFLILFASCMIFSQNLNAQSDKQIIKTSKALLDKKVYDSAFLMIITVKKAKSGKVQGIIKKAYPGLVSANVRKANKIKILPKDDGATKCEKTEAQLEIIRQSLTADSLLKTVTKEQDYKSMTRKRSIDKSISKYNTQLQLTKDKIAQQEAEEQRIADSISLAEQMEAQRIADSLAALKDTVTLVTTVENPPISGVLYYIIAGSYHSESRALAEVEKLKNKGFPNAKTVNRNDDGNLRICFDFYENRDDAARDLPDIRRKHRKDAWVLEL